MLKVLLRPREAAIGAIERLLEEYSGLHPEFAVDVAMNTITRAKNSLVKNLAIDFLFCSAVAVFLSLAILNPIAAAVNAGAIEAPPTGRTLALIINAYEVATLPVMLSGVSGLIRLTYLFFVRVLPYRGGGRRVLLGAWLLTAFDGGWIFTPAVTLLSIGHTMGLEEPIAWKIAQQWAKIRKRIMFWK